MLARTLRIAALASTCLWPLGAWADDDDFDLGEAPAATGETRKPVLVNEMSVGAGYQTQESGRFGRFTGATQEGGFTRGSARIQHRATDADAGTAYMIMEADGIDLRSNQALPDASALVRFGEQGLWDASLSYAGIPYQQSDNYHTLFGSSGELLNGLTARSITQAATTGAAQVNARLAVTEIGTRRDQVGGKVSYSGLQDWVFSSKMEHEHKQGTKANAMLFLTDNYFAAFAEPVDYNTDRFTAAAAYTTKPFQAKLSYTFSNFTNEQSQFQTLDPFNAATRAGYQATQYSLPPSNSEHQFKGQFGLNVTEATHVALNLRYGLQLQNEAFNARFYEAPNATTPLIADSAYDGMIQNLYGNIALTSRPMKDWNFRAAYTVDDRDNSSQVYKVRTYRGDGGTGVFNGGPDARYNTPYSFLNQRIDLEAGYRLLKSTKLTLDYNFQDRQRTYSVTNRNQESTLGGKVQSTLWPGVTGTLGYSNSIRQATAYGGNRGWEEQGRTTGGLATNDRIQEGDLGQYNYAARNRDEVKANVNWGMGEDLSLGATARYVSDRFPNSYYGVTDNHILSAGPDITYTPVKAVTTHFYYTYQENFTNLMVNASAVTTAGSTLGQANGAVWNLDNQDTVHSIGTRTDWQVNDRLKLSLENNLSYGNTAFEEASWWQGAGTASAANTAVTLPNNKSVTNSLMVSGEYQILENVFVGLSGLWERFLSKDYLNAQQAASTANQTNTATFAAEGNPSYSVGVLMASTRIVW
jgi:MtrB/PioB family decaheme-associated outer membrane protein